MHKNTINLLKFSPSSNSYILEYSLPICFLGKIYFQFNIIYTALTFAFPPQIPSLTRALVTQSYFVPSQMLSNSATVELYLQYVLMFFRNHSLILYSIVLPPHP